MTNSIKMGMFDKLLTFLRRERSYQYNLLDMEKFTVHLKNSPQYVFKKTSSESLTLSVKL
jgi:hypothetical protein